MSGFQSANPLWDFTLPTDALTTLPDDDFLAILQSQIATTNGLADPTSFFIPQQIHQDIPLSANPKSLTRVPDPPTNASPLTDSSPSPPSGQDGTPPESVSNGRGAVNGRHSTHDEMLKRKASREDEDDEDDGPPTNKSHTAQSKASRRKSGANGGADEVRLMKRKEQNRAAQRAFRERKEKHVKDLEDQLAVSEEKNNSTQSENDNLKEMLRRLQAENTLLKQAAFTFSVPRASNTKNSNQPVDPSNSAIASTSQSEAQKYIAQISRKDTTGSTSSSQPSPVSLVDDTFGDVYTASSSVTTDSPQLESEKSPSSSSANYASSGFDWMSSQSPLPSSTTNTLLQSPFTIISSNPTYMSYRDIPAPTSDFSMFSSLQSFDNQSYPMDQNSQMSSFFPQPDVLMKDYSTQADPGTFTFSPLSTSRELSALDDLFGGQASAVPAFSPYPIGTSPVSHAGSTSKSTPSSDLSDYPCPTTGCSKEDVAGLIAAKGPSTFVTGVTNTAPFENSQSLFEGIHLQPIEANENNVDACAAFDSLKNRPEFKDCDINSLCKEFAAKARCDGVRAVIPQDGIQELMDSLGFAAKSSN